MQYCRATRDFTMHVFRLVLAMAFAGFSPGRYISPEQLPAGATVF